MAAFLCSRFVFIRLMDGHFKRNKRRRNKKGPEPRKTQNTRNKKYTNPVKIANLISKLNFYKLIPYPMLIRSARTGSPNVRKRRPVFPPAKPAQHCALARWRVVLPSCLDSVTS